MPVESPNRQQRADCRWGVRRPREEAIIRTAAVRAVRGLKWNSLAWGWEGNVEFNLFGLFHYREAGDAGCSLASFTAIRPNGPITLTVRYREPRRSSFSFVWFMTKIRLRLGKLAIIASACFCLLELTLFAITKFNRLNIFRCLAMHLISGNRFRLIIGC